MAAKPMPTQSPTLSDCPIDDGGLEQFLATIYADGGMRELRALKVRRSVYPDKVPHTEFSYYKDSEQAAFAKAAGHFRDGNPQIDGLSALKGVAGVYYTLNPVKPAAYGKAPNRLHTAQSGEPTADRDVLRRTLLLIDIDSPREVDGVPATAAEKEQGKSLMRRLRAFLDDLCWPEPIVVDSGNGFQLLYRVNLPADDGGLVKRVLEALGAKFSGPDGNVDQTVHNAARIARLPGTWNCKAETTNERPYRMARVLSLPAKFDALTEELILAVADLAPEEAAAPGSRRQDKSGRTQPGAPDQFREAVSRWNKDHPRAFPARSSPCVICGSPDGLKASSGSSDRWTCFSSRHQELRDARDGVGLAGKACFSGDSLDIEAWTSNRSRLQVLVDDGYLSPKSRRRRRESPESPTHMPTGATTQNDDPEGDRREEVYFHRSSGEVPLHVLVPRAVELLARNAQDEIYVHGENLAHVVDANKDTRPQGDRSSSSAPRIRPYPVSVLRERLDAVGKWMHEKETDNGTTRVEERWCPKEVVNAVRDKGSWPGLRTLVGVTGAPILRPNLTVLDSQGYDQDTGLLYLPSCKYPPVPMAPTRREAETATDVLLAPFADFPIVSPASRSALLAYLLTLAGRPAIGGHVPMTGVTARVPGTGKTLLVDCATVAMTGHLPDKLMVPGGRQGDADAEWRKRIVTLAIEGSRAVLIDNVPDGATLQSSCLALSLTAAEVTDRLLATNRSARVPHRIVWTYTGNNVSLAADLARRSLGVDLDAKVEDPHLRSSFRIANLVQHVRDNHPTLLTAGLTVLRGFAEAGCPQHDRPKLGMFEDWDSLIRACVIWLTGDDPVDTQLRLRGESPENEGLAVILAAWRATIGVDKAVQARDLLLIPALATALAEALPGHHDRDLPSTKAVGQFLRRNAGRVRTGLCIDRTGEFTGTALWTLREVSR